MFNFLKKNPKIEFVSLIPSVAQIMPIIPAAEVKRSWLKKAAEDYKKLRQMKPVLNEKEASITRCPGIAKINREGWVQRTWQDIYIKTNGDGVSFSGNTAIDQQTYYNDHNLLEPKYVSYHHESQYGVYNQSKNTLRTVIKIASPWIVYIPKGYYLISMPIPFSDRNEFTAATGILDCDDGPNVINVQLFWHVLDGEVHIPAGTPIAQYILVKKEKKNFINRESNKDDIYNMNLRANAISNRFVGFYNSLKGFKFK